MDTLKIEDRLDLNRRDLLDEGNQPFIKYLCHPTQTNLSNAFYLIIYGNKRKSPKLGLGHGFVFIFSGE